MKLYTEAEVRKAMRLASSYLHILRSTENAIVTLLNSIEIPIDQEEEINDIREIKVGDIVVEKLSSGFYDIFEIHTENDINRKTQLKVLKPL